MQLSSLSQGLRLAECRVEVAPPKIKEIAVRQSEQRLFQAAEQRNIPSCAIKKLLLVESTFMDHPSLTGAVWESIIKTVET